MLAFLKPHIFWVVLISTGLILGHSWLGEHDARIRADATISQSQAQIKVLTSSNAQLRTQIAVSDAKAQKALSALQASASKVKTPGQAIAAIPDVSTLSLRPQPTPDLSRVSVDALTLYTELNACRQNEAQLEACQSARNADNQIIQNDNRESMMKDAEIKALKAKPDFWHRVWGTVKSVGIGIGIGVALGSKL